MISKPTKIRAAVGRVNSGPRRGYVMLEDVQEWMTPRQTRAFCARLEKAATRAEAALERWKRRPPKARG